MLRKQFKHKMNAKYVQKNIPPFSTDKKYFCENIQPETQTLIDFIMHIPSYFDFLTYRTIGPGFGAAVCAL